MNDATPSSISYDHLTNPVPVLRTFQPSDDSINDALPRISLWNQSLPTVQLWSERHARTAHLNQYDTGAWKFFYKPTIFCLLMYSNLVYVSVIIFFFFSHRYYSATTRTRALGRRLSNHYVFFKTKTLKFFCKRTNNIHNFEGGHSSKLS